MNRSGIGKVLVALQAILAVPIALLIFMPGQGWIPIVLVAFAVASLVFLLPGASPARVVLAGGGAYAATLLLMPGATGLGLMSQPQFYSPFVFAAWAATALVSVFLLGVPHARGKASAAAVVAVVLIGLLPVHFARVLPAFRASLWWLPSSAAILAAVAMGLWRLPKARTV